MTESVRLHRGGARAFVPAGDNLPREMLSAFRYACCGAACPTHPPTMKLSTSHLKRYKEIARLLWKYGRADLAQQMTVDGEGFNVDEIKTAAPGEASPEHLADDLEAMGPTFVKLGQVLAGRP